MAGYRYVSYESGPLPNLSVSYPTEVDYPRGGAYGLGLADAIDGDQFVENLPISELPVSMIGWRMGSFFDDYYNAIYLLPPSINFGAVTDDIEQPFVVWNAYTRPKTLANIVISGGSGLQLIGPGPGTNFAAVSYRSYRLLATTSGPAYINATYRFRFTDVDRDPVLPVSGARAELWLALPNWARAYNITYSYKTDMIVSRSGTEQRRALRNTPRKTIDFEMLGYDENLRWFNRVMDGWQRNAFLLPELVRHVDSASDMAVGSTQIMLTSIPTWLKVGASVVLIHGNQVAAFLVEAIDSIDPLVTFTIQSKDYWPAGTKVHPGLSGRLASSISTRRHTSNAGTINVVFNQEPGSEIYPPPPVAPVLWRSTEVVLHKPNYLNPITLSHAWDVETVDFDRGIIKTYVPIDHGSRTWKADYLGIGRDKVQEFLDIFHRCKGRRTAFYMPTWENDVPPVDPLSVGSFRIRTKGDQVYRLLRNTTVNRNVAVLLFDGTILFNRVQQIIPIMDERGSDSVLTLANSWQQSVPIDQIMKICWMPLWRFASDSLTIAWVTDEVATISATMFRLEDNP